MSEVMGTNFQPKMVAGHSLGEFSALVASGVLSFEDGLKLVRERAFAMQEACELSHVTMAAILGLDDKKIELICKTTPGIVVTANYNCPGQLVISGEKKSIENACENLIEVGARRAVILPVGGAFHSPLMESAKERLSKAIKKTKLILGTNKKILLPVEKPNIKEARKSIVAKKIIKKGQIFTKNNITTKRPYYGICASKWFQILGKRSKKNFKKNDFIKI